MTEQNNKPVAKRRDGAIETAIWKRSTEQGNFYQAERTRSFKDKNGDWQKTHSIPEKDLLKAARLDEWAHDQIQDMRSAERQKYIEDQQQSSDQAQSREHPREH